MPVILFGLSEVMLIFASLFMLITPGIRELCACVAVVFGTIFLFQQVVRYYNQTYEPPHPSEQKGHWIWDQLLQLIGLSMAAGYCFGWYVILYPKFETYPIENAIARIILINCAVIGSALVLCRNKKVVQTFVW